MAFVMEAIKRRKFLGLNQGQLAVRAKVGLSMIAKMEQTGEPPKKRASVLKIAEALGMKPPPFEIEDDVPAGLDPSSVDVRPIPCWDLSCSAAIWVPIPICELDANDPAQFEVISRGLFRLRVDGDCMEPEYPHGTIVEFRIIRLGQEPLIPDEHYVFCRTDGTGTFKQFVTGDDETTTLRALNRKRYPSLIKFPTQEIGRVAIADAKVMPRHDSKGNGVS